MYLDPEQEKDKSLFVDKDVQKYFVCDYALVVLINLLVILDKR